MSEWDGLRIEIDELRRVFERVVSHVEQRNGRTVTLREDSFYSLPAPDLYNVQDDPPEPTIGQLTESWDNLVHRGTADHPVTFELVWLGDVLRAVGHLVEDRA